MLKLRIWITDISVYIIGSFLFAVSVNSFSVPNNITTGGFTGIAIMANFLFKIPVGILIFLLNIPIFLWGYKQQGKRFMLKTVIATFISSVVIDITSPLLPIYTGDLMLASVFAGVFSGLGLGIIFLRGGTTGGTELTASLILRHFRHLSIGKLILLMDFIIVAFSAVVYKNIENPMYASIVIFISTKLIDTILYDKSEKMLLIISEKHAEISDMLLYDIKRGVTLLSARGGYTQKTTMAILCALSRYEARKIYNLIKKIDENAFIITLDTSEISGNGFEKYGTM
jgi:uncharacterized membrane-anchored protein YitT (DUF2179 family)